MRYKTFSVLQENTLKNTPTKTPSLQLLERAFMADKKYPEIPAQKQSQQPGHENKMDPRPAFKQAERKGSERLKQKIALITGGDSGIGRSVAVLFAREGAKLAIVYLNEDEDAQETQRLVEAEGSECLLIKGDVGSETFCQEAVQTTVDTYDALNIVVNNAAEQHPRESLEEITEAQLERTFRTNIFAQFFITKAALAHLKEGDCIINTTSVTAFRGSPGLID